MDELLEQAFEQGSSTSRCQCNPFPLCVLTPLDAAIVKTYSDARNQLTGVIESPETLNMVSEGFWLTLVWLTLRHAVYSNTSKTDTGSVTLLCGYGDSVPNTVSQGVLQRNNTIRERSDHRHDNDLGVSQKKPGTSNSNASPSQSDSVISSSWSDDNESLFGDNSNNNKDTRLGSNSVTLHSLNAVQSETVDRFDFGLPAVDISTTAHPKCNIANRHHSLGPTATGMTGLPAQTGTVFDLPAGWLKLPQQLQSRLPAWIGHFPKEWFGYVLTHLEESVASGNVISVEYKEKLEKAYSCFTAACHGMIYELGAYDIYLTIYM